MATFRVSQCQDGVKVNEDVRTLKDVIEKQTHEKTQYLTARRLFCKKIQKSLNLSQNLYSKLLST